MRSKPYQRRIHWALRQSLSPIRNGAEIGVWRGETSRWFLRKFPQLHLLMVDRYIKYLPHEPAPRIGKCDQDQVHQALVTAMERTSFAVERRTFLIETSVMASARVPDSSLDFVYIDAGHDYNNVKCDLAAWAPKVRPGGIIVGDDYGGPSDKVGKFGVKKAVTEAFGDKVKVERYRIWWTRK